MKIELEMTDEDYKMFFKQSIISAYVNSDGVEKSFYEYILKVLEEQEGKESEVTIDES